VRRSVRQPAPGPAPRGDGRLDVAGPDGSAAAARAHAAGGPAHVARPARPGDLLDGLFPAPLASKIHVLIVNGLNLAGPCC
jgi:hypothetical protein